MKFDGKSIARAMLAKREEEGSSKGGMNPEVGNEGKEVIEDVESASIPSWVNDLICGIHDKNHDVVHKILKPYYDMNSGGKRSGKMEE